MTRDRMVESLETRIEAKNKLLEALTDDYFALSAAIESENDPVTKNRYKRRSKEMETEMDEVGAELDALRLRWDSRHSLLQLQSKLSKIDFKILQDTIEKIFQYQNDEPCTALLLFQNSMSMGGEWCAKRIQEILRCQTGAGLFRHMPVEFQSREPADAIALMRRLGQYLGIEPAGQNLENSTQGVIQKLCDSLQYGSVFMIECWGCDYLSLEPDIFRWVLKDFWMNTVHKLTAVAKTKKCVKVKVIMLLFVDGRLPENCLLTDQCCTLEQFEKDKLLEIPLELWTREHIREWIESCSGLSLPSDQVERMTNKIYGGSLCGIPKMVAEQLLNECRPTFAD